MTLLGDVLRIIGIGRPIQGELSIRAVGDDAEERAKALDERPPAETDPDRWTIKPSQRQGD